MPPPQRQDYDSVIADLERRLAKLEQAQRATSIFLPSSGTAPVASPLGGFFYVSAGAVHYRGPTTDTTVAPA
ncbi:MAG: hypothetical protein H0U53_03845 [Actinobacteria bacterium]|nr:hypothetical protein [Actinomycetota bacterium]